MADRTVPSATSRLRTYGADLSRWPEGDADVRRSLLADPEIRRVFEEERQLDRLLSAERDSLDEEVAASGAVERLAGMGLRACATDVIAEIPWRQVAAGILLAGMLGGAVDFLLPQPSDPLELALVDPLGASELE